MSIADLGPNTPADSANIGNGAGLIREINNALLEAFGGVAGPIENASGVGNDPPTHVDFSNLFNRIKAIEDTLAALDTGEGGGSIQLFPVNTIIMWFGALNAIPDGWALCDGAGGRPNLLDKFIIGAGNDYPVGAQGGSFQTGDSGEAAEITLNLADHVLTEANIPQHEHFIAHNSAADPLSPAQVAAGDYAAVRRQDADDDAYSLSQQVGANNNVSNVGRTSPYGQASPAPLTHDAASATISGHSHDAIPPYYALAYIIKVAV